MVRDRVGKKYKDTSTTFPTRYRYMM